MRRAAAFVGIDPERARAFGDLLAYTSSQADDLRAEIASALVAAELTSDAAVQVGAISEHLRTTQRVVERRAESAERFRVALRRAGSPTMPRASFISARGTRRVRTTRSAQLSSTARRHTVRRGDTLSAIARRNGLTWTALARHNGLRNPHLLRPGQVLTIPTARGTIGAPKRSRRTTTRAVPVAPVPGTGSRTSKARAAYRSLRAQGERVDGFNASSAEHKATNPNSDHDRGLAFDWHVRGDAYVRKALALPGVRYVIHDSKIYHRRDGFVPRPYVGRFTTGKRKDPHRNHIHVNF